MKANIVCFLLALLVFDPALILAGGQKEVLYVGGTIGTPNPGGLGALNTSKDDRLIFEAAKGNIEIPYESITSAQYDTKLARRLGVLPAISISLLRKRQRKHFLTVTFGQASDPPQVIVLEIPKTMVKVVVSVIEARTGRPVRQ